MRLLRKRHIFLRSAQRSDRKVPNGSAPTFFSDQTAIEEFILFEQSRYAGVDLKTAGALMMNDYSYILAAATVPLFTGFGLIPGLSPASVGLRFYTTEKLHEGKIYRARRAHVQFVESLFWYGQLDKDIDGERLRTELEKHFSSRCRADPYEDGAFTCRTLALSGRRDRLPLSGHGTPV
ncbi:hypothetical protein ASD74_01680 [Rhizobium sp. Root564]|nr:hypothetical protein ASD74_01680 [Rhizobium sp. Root564]